MKGLSDSVQWPNRYIASCCERLLSLNPAITFVGLADYAGKLLHTSQRQGLGELMDQKETAQYALQSVFRARSRGGFREVMGEHRFAVSVYDRVIRATLTLSHPSTDHHTLYLLVSMDSGSPYQHVLDRLYPQAEGMKEGLFARTLPMSSKYRD